jgi:antirestriction protein ArdC
MATTSRKKAQKQFDGPKPEEVLVADLVSLLESGTSPWQRPWSGTDGIHRNLVTGEPYRGANPLLLEAGLALRQQSIPLWLGIGQAKEHGWFPRKGSKSVRIFRPQLNKKETGELDTNGDPEITAWVSFKVIPVFHVMDLDATSEEAAQDLQKRINEACNREVQAESVRIENAEQVLESWPVKVNFGANKAFYQPSEDEITLPNVEQFHSRESYIATRAHEAAHSTGHKTRLARDLYNAYGSTGYAREELIAEMASVLICNRLQVSYQLEQHASYLTNWASILSEGGSKVLFSILREAKQAADLIIAEPDS